jgi:hypothetical protein
MNNIDSWERQQHWKQREENRFERDIRRTTSGCQPQVECDWWSEEEG